MRDGPSTAGIDPSQWRDWAEASGTGRRIAHAPRHRSSGFDRARLECWTDTSPVMDQPALNHHLIVLHEGGPKRIERRSGRRCKTVDAALGSSTTIECGSAYRWNTQGPIAFSHIYVAPDRFAEIVASTFDRDSRRVGFAESIGRPDPHVARLIDLMIASRDDPDWPVIGDFYLDALLIRLAATSTSGAHFRLPEPSILTRPTVARVQEYIRGNLNAAVSLDDLAAVAGYSRYHFVRAFKSATGLPPHTFLINERVLAAKELLASPDLPIAQIAVSTGFSTHAHFSARFRESTGMTPAQYRRRLRGDG